MEDISLKETILKNGLTQVEKVWEESRKLFIEVRRFNDDKSYDRKSYCEIKFVHVRDWNHSPSALSSGWMSPWSLKGNDSPLFSSRAKAIGSIKRYLKTDYYFAGFYTGMIVSYGDIVTDDGLKLEQSNKFQAYYTEK
ncbi:hypothetical protein OAP38_03415 [Opitutales bacterium]|nr:hypothetical protein [Opitutales bacterium]